MWYRIRNIGLLFLLLPGAIAKAQAPSAPKGVVETVLLPAGQIVIGQRCELVVRFLTDGFAFPQPPRFGDMKIPRTIVIPPQSGMNISERRQGQTWVGVERRYALFPTKAGPLRIDAVRMQARVRNSDGVADVQAASKPLLREVVVPKAFAGVGRVVVTSKLTLARRLEPDAREFRVGDALKRAITITAADTAAMLLPAIPPAKAEGLAAYPDKPSLQYHSERGETTATRRDSVTYVFEREGEYRLPEVTVHWWEPSARELRQAKLPELTVRVRPAPGVATSQGAARPEDMAAPGGSRAGLWIGLAVAAVACAALVWAWRKHGSRLRVALAAWREAREESEAAYFVRFRHACRSGDPRGTMGSLLAWVNRREDLGGAATTTELCRHAGDPELTRLIEELNALLYGSTGAGLGTWSGIELYGRVVRARRHLRRESTARARSDGLGPLNPRATG